MSTTPNALLETTAATEELLDVESIKALLDGFDPAALLPDLSKVFDSLVPLCRIAVLAGPVVLLLLTAAFYFVRDDGWDRLGALIFAFAGAVCGTGVFFGWVAFLPRRKDKKDKNEQ